MRKFLAIYISINLLYGCGGMKGLRRQSSQNIHKTVQEQSELYYNDTYGHNEEVIMEVIDEHNAVLKIPIRYTQKIGSIPRTLPDVTKQVLEESHIADKSRTDVSNVVVCAHCLVDKNIMKIPLQYTETNCGETVILTTIFSPIFLIATPFVTVFGNVSEFFSSIGDSVKEGCVSSLKNQEGIGLFFKWNSRALSEVGIKLQVAITPANFKIICDKKACSVVDNNGKIVNEILVEKNLSLDTQKIQELLIKERKEKEAKRRRKEEQRAKCPGLFRQIVLFERGYYIDPIEHSHVVRKFAELECYEWVSEAMY